MTATAAQLQAALDNFTDNLTKVDSIINGDDTTDVTIDSGTVPSIAKLQVLMQGSLTATSFDFAGDGATVTFTCSGATINGVNGVLVSVDGVLIETTEYTISGTEDVVFGAAPTNLASIQCRVLGTPQSLASATADNVQYSQGSTGYSARSTEAKFQTEALSLLDFGADPTGVASSAGALSSALDAAMTLGRPLRIPAGTYLLSSWTMKTTTARLDILADPGATFNCTASGAYFVEPDHEFTVDGLTVIGFERFLSQGTTGGAKVEEISVTNCRFETPETNYIYIRTPFEKCEVRNCIFDGTGSTDPNRILYIGIGGTGIVGDYRYLRITDNIFQDMACALAGTFYVIFTYSDSAEIRGNLFRNLQHSGGAYETDIIYAKCRYASITDNVFDTFTPNSSTPVSVMRLEGIERGGTISATTTDMYGHTNHVAGNSVVGYSSASLLYCVRSSIDEVSIRGNIVYNVLADTSGFSYGIFVSDTTAFGVSITGNQVTGCRRGIYVAGDRNLVIANNIVSDYSAYGIYAQTETGANDSAVLAGNLINDEGSSLTGGAAIRIQQGRWAISGNVLYDSGAAEYAMYLASGATECAVTGNRVSGGATNCVQLLGSVNLLTGNVLIGGTINQSASGSIVNNNSVDGSLDAAPGVFAACKITGWSSPTVVAGSVNISGASYAAGDVTITFTTAAADTNYLVLVTPDWDGVSAQPGQPAISGVTAADFDITFDTAPSGASIIVYRF
jgi:parallel beta-helix repeat protein